MKKVKSTFLKVLIITIVFATYLLSTSAKTSKQQSNYTKRSVLQYLVKDILLSGNAKGKAILYMAYERWNRKDSLLDLQGVSPLRMNANNRLLMSGRVVSEVLLSLHGAFEVVRIPHTNLLAL